MALKDITLGQYFPGNTLLHRLDPRTKLLGTVAYIVALFLAKGIVGYAVLLAVLAALIAVSRVGLKTILRGMKPILVIIIITAVLNLFYTPGAGEPLAAFWIFNIYPEGIWAAVYMILRIAMLIACTFLLTYTTSPILLTDGLEKLLGPLKAIRVPVHELAMMMSIALRFIPTLIEETDKIMSAQKARGADFDTGSLMQKARALVPLLVPLFISAFRRADELAVAMGAAAITAGEGRTRLRVLRFRGADVARTGRQRGSVRAGRRAAAVRALDPCLGACANANRRVLAPRCGHPRAAAPGACLNARGRTNGRRSWNRFRFQASNDPQTSNFRKN